MPNRVRVSLIVVNAVGAIVFLALWFYAAWLAPLGSGGRVTDLDRAGVIDVQKLSALHPGLAVNVRRDLADWIAAREREASKIASVAGLVFCVTNLVIIRYLGRGQCKQAPLVPERTAPPGRDWSGGGGYAGGAVGARRTEQN